LIVENEFSRLSGHADGYVFVNGVNSVLPVLPI
jgi:hypothetical protein